MIDCIRKKVVGEHFVKRNACDQSRKLEDQASAPVPHINKTQLLRNADEWRTAPQCLSYVVTECQNKVKICHPPVPSKTLLRTVPPGPLTPFSGVPGTAGIR